MKMKQEEYPHLQSLYQEIVIVNFFYHSEIKKSVGKGGVKNA